MTTTTPHTLSQLADIGAAASLRYITGSLLQMYDSHPAYAEDAPAREAFAKAVLDAVGYRLPVDPEREAFEKWRNETGSPESDFIFAAWKAGREELRKAQMLDKEPSQPENDGWKNWPGGERPVDKFAKVEVRYRGIDEGDILQADNLRWDHINHQSDIIAYKIVG
jgi:hypothetical protein